MQGVFFYFHLQAKNIYFFKNKTPINHLKKLFSFLFSIAALYLTLYLTLMNLEGRIKGA